MVKTVDEGFRQFHSWLTPTKTEEDSASSHRESVLDCISNSYRVKNFFRTGSFGNGTSIRGTSDTDYFAVINENDLSGSSGYTLSKLRDVLDKRFPSTGVAVRTPGVTIPFGTGGCETTEVIPACYSETKEGHNIYLMPDSNDRWMTSCPQAHLDYVSKINDDLGGKVKPLIRFIKAWAYYNSIPIKSFFLEMWVAHYASGEKSIVYYIDLMSIFRSLDRDGLHPMYDPTGLTGKIAPCKTDTMLEIAKSRISTAASRTEKAFEAAKDGDISTAFYYLGLVFNNQFPSY